MQDTTKEDLYYKICEELNLHDKEREILWEALTSSRDNSKGNTRSPSVNLENWKTGTIDGKKHSVKFVDPDLGTFWPEGYVEQLLSAQEEKTLSKIRRFASSGPVNKKSLLVYLDCLEVLTNLSKDKQ